MVTQYPYKCFVYAQGNASVQDADLEFLPAENNDWVFHSICRDEQNTSTNVILSASGLQYNYNYLIQLPKGCTPLQIGDKIKVVDCNENLRCDGIVQMFKKDQLHSRAWL